MLFIELRFLLFFILVFSIYWALPGNTSRKLWLLFSSYVFYAAWDWRFLSLILISTTVDYWVGLRLHQNKTESQRRWLLITSLCINFGLLAFFKYLNFFYDSTVAFFRLLGLNFSESTMKIILPVGISFYTFQTLSYTIDIYRRKLDPSKNFLDVALFVAFFPQLVAGPIVRASVFLPQLKDKKIFSGVKVRTFLLLFLTGFIKKACIADNLAPFVDSYYAYPGAYNGLSSLISTFAYSIQIYCDFSGYSDMAIACAGLMGYHFPLNFNFPHFARNLTDFWRRWHISFSTWLRDYLYISLGGNRKKRVFLYRNLMITLLLGGLWHGAGWTFVIWGGINGIALIIQKVWSKNVKITNNISLKKIWALISVGLTFYWLTFARIFFRAEDLGKSWKIVKSFVFLKGEGKALPSQLFLIFLLLAIVSWAAMKLKEKNWQEKIPAWQFAIGYGAALAISFSLVPLNYRPFIYFQF